jgi:hypothetical protein
VDELEAKFEKARASYTQAKAALDKRRAALAHWDDEVGGVAGGLHVED